MPRDAFLGGTPLPAPGSSYCEWKGRASYWSLRVGDFYGGWITKHVKGPFKGDPGTSGW